MVEIVHKELSYAIVGAGMEVHRILGPGFLVLVYQAALAHEFALRCIHFEAQKNLPVRYKDISIGDYIADFLVEDQIIVEIKAISNLTEAHEAQAHHYLAATGMRLAILMNFGSPSLQTKHILRG
jgi:GxxExxY protein